MLSLLHAVPPNLQATTNPHLGQRLPDTHGVTAPFSWVLVHTRFCLCPPRVSVSPVLWKFSNQIPLTFKVRFPGDSQSLCQIPRLRSLLGCLELSQQCENFSDIIVLQFVDHPPGSSVMRLMATSGELEIKFLTSIGS